MSSEKPNFLSQPVVKNIFMFRNGDPYYEARRIVINQKRVSNFETLLREVTGGIQAPFGAVRNIYTPRGGHKVDCLESLQSGEQYVAAGRERFKRLDYLQIGTRRKKMMQTLPMHAKPLPPNRIIVSARFLKPLKEPCTIFVVANGDILDPAMRLLIHQRMLGQFERILEMITEKMGLKVLGGVRSLYTYEGHQVTDGNHLESGQLYVAVGREKFKKLPYSDLLFTKPRGTRRVNGMKAYSLPPIYRFSKQNGNSKSIVRSSDSGGSKASPPAHNGSNKEHLSSIVREISQARLLSLRKKKSGQSMTLGIADSDDVESKADDGNAEDKTAQDQPAEEKPADVDTKAAEEDGEKAGEGEEAAAEKTTEEDSSADKEENKENQEANGSGSEEKVEEEVKEEVKSEEQGSSEDSGDKTQDGKEKEEGSNGSPEGEKDERDKNLNEEERDKDDGKGENNGEEQVNDVDTGEEEKGTEDADDPAKTRPDNETKENHDGGSGSGSGSGSGGDQEEDGRDETKEGAAKEAGEEERKANGEVSGDDGVESEAEPDPEEKQSAAENGEKEQDGDDKDNQDKSRKEKD